MPLFEFDDAGPNVSHPASINFTEDGVNFVLSTTGNGGANSITYAPAAGRLSLSDFNGGVPGSNAPFTLDVTAGAVNGNFAQTAGGNVQIVLGNSVSGSWNITLLATSGAGGNVVLGAASGDSGNALTFAGGGLEFSAIRFTPTTNDAFINIESLNASIVCYLEGTGIATPNGDVAVEDLKVGDLVMTADGGTTSVKWLGEQPVDTRKATPSKVNPICLVKDAIAPNVPARDLFVSPDHAIEIDGMLYNAHALVNGRSIYQTAHMPLEGFTYFHVDTGAHELILAENCPAESFLDAVDRDNFINGADRADAEIIPEMALPRIAAKRMVPAPVAQALDARADALGLALPKAVRAA